MLPSLTPNSWNGLQALLGVILAGLGVACQFGTWYGVSVAGFLLVVLAMADSR